MNLDYQPDVGRKISGKPTPEEQEREERLQDRSDERDFRRNQIRTNNRLVTVAVLTAIVSVLAIAVGVWQTYLTRQAIQVSIRQAQLTEEANKLTRDNMDSSAKQSAEQRKEAKRQNDLASKNSEAALNATINATRLDERAWVGVRETNLNAPIEQGKPITASVSFVNTGKTIALIRAKIDLVTAHKASIEPAFDPGRWKEDKMSPEVLFPGTPLAMSITAYPGGASKSILDEIGKGETVIYMVGQCHYKDVFNEPHLTEFCLQYNVSRKGFVSCPNHNRAD